MPQTSSEETSFRRTLCSLSDDICDDTFSLKARDKVETKEEASAADPPRSDASEIESEALKGARKLALAKGSKQIPHSISSTTSGPKTCFSCTGSTKPVMQENISCIIETRVAGIRRRKLKCQPSAGKGLVTPSKN